MSLRILRIGDRSSSQVTAQEVLCPTCLPYADVTAFGADPTGVADSTTAFQDVWTASTASSTILVPAGTYLVDADAVTWHSRRWVGEYENASILTTIRARTAGTWLIQTGSLAAFENLKIDGQNTVATPLLLNPAHATLVQNCLITGGATYGARIVNGSVYFESVVVDSCEEGLGLEGPNACTFINVTVTNCNSRGVNHSATVQSGAMTWIGGLVKDNGGTEQIYFNGVEGSVYSSIHIEGAADGVLFDNFARNITLSGCTFVGPETNYAIRYGNAFMNTIVGCSATGDDYRRIRIDGDNTQVREISIVGGGEIGGAGAWRRYDPAGPDTFEPHGSGALTGTGPPTVGLWRVGSVIINTAAGSTTGWRCTVAGTPGTWVAF